MKIYEEAQLATTPKYVSAIPCKKCGGTVRTKSSLGRCMNCLETFAAKHKSKERTKALAAKAARGKRARDKVEVARATLALALVEVAEAEDKLAEAEKALKKIYPPKRKSPNANSPNAIRIRRCKAKNTETGMSHREREEYRKFCEKRALNE